MNKRRTRVIALVIMSLLAVVSVVGVIFAFNNSGTQHDAYGSITVTADKTNIELDIEVERDENTDNGLRLADTPSRSAYLMITVGGLPDTADRGVTFNGSSASSGTVTVTPAGFDRKNGLNRFLITGQNGGAPVTLLFTTRSGNQTIAVNVSVNLTATNFQLAKGAHFGIRQNGEPLDFKKASTLAKFDFFAHPADTNQTYKPNNFPLVYGLAENYPGVTLTDGVLSVGDDFVFDDGADGREIYVLAQLPTMDEAVAIPVYVFRPADAITVTTDAYVPDPNSSVYDLILNRSEHISANFAFALPDNQGTVGEDYNFFVTAQDTTMVNVTKGNTGDAGKYELSAVRNTGLTKVTVTAYPRAYMTVDGERKQVWFNDPDSDANVFVTHEVFLRVRNEFIDQSENSGYVNWKLQYSKEQLSAFYYEGSGAGYTDQFTLDTLNNQPITFENDIEFELVVKDVNGKLTTYNRTNGMFDILALSVYRDGYWQPLDEVNYYANYRENFAVALTRTTEAESYLTRNIANMWLRAKSVSPLSISTADNPRYATWDVPMVAYGAIDRFEITNLTTLDDGTAGVALVHRQGSSEVSSTTLEVYGVLEKGTDTVHSSRWNPAAITLNENFPFEVTREDQTGSEIKCTYTLTLRNGANVQYYNSYPFTLTYPNGVTQTIYVKIFPTVGQVSMNVVSDNHGQIYRTVNDPSNREYIKTVYVKQGATYRINVATADVSVGAYAEIEENGETGLTFDARDRAEGLYTVKAYLRAYSDDVYVNHQQEFTVNFVVVSPVGNVAAKSEITLPGINGSEEITVAPTSGSDEYLHVDPVLTDPNLTIDRLSKTTFRLTARYLTNEPVTIGFRVYKRYAFDIDFDGDGEADVFDLLYTAGNLIPVAVTIKTNDRVSSVIIDGDTNVVQTEKELGKYISIVSEPATTVELTLNTTGAGSYRDVGFAFAKYENGTFSLTKMLDVEEVPVLAKAGFNAAGNLVIEPVAGKRSMGMYALIAYAKDSLYLVATENGQEKWLPYTYEVVPLYLGTAEEIQTVIDEMKKGVVHDANSGLRNNLGGYNWAIAADDGSYYAAVFYTNPTTHNEYSSKITANRYYLDDLEMILGEAWGDALNQYSYQLTKHINGSNTAVTLNDVENAYQLNSEKGRMYFQVGDCSGYVTDEDGNTVRQEITYRLTAYDKDGQSANFNLHFYAVESVETFNVSLSGVGNGVGGIIVEKDLTPNDQDISQYQDTVKVQRGRYFDLVGNVRNNIGAAALWEVTNADTTNSNGPSYAGGRYEFTPYINFHDQGGYAKRFTLTALQTTVKVGITGGIQYLNMVQSSNTMDGLTSAIYNVTLRSDEAWNSTLLNYILDYDGVRYPLFLDVTGEGTLTDEVIMEGGNAAFYFKLIPTPGNAASNDYYTHYLRIEVSIILKSAATNPFSNVSGARLILQENLSGSTLEGTKVAREVSAGLNVNKQGITNVAMAHFANINIDSNTGSITIPNSQTDTNVIYVDNNAVGGVLTVHPSPYYLDVDTMSIECVKPVEVTSQIGTSLDGEAITGTARYTIGFTQLVYNTDEQVYQNFLSGTSPKMVSTWSKKDGYQWNGRYYFRTYLRCDGQAEAAIADGAEFKIAVTITSEGYKRITEQMTIYAKYKDGIVVTPDDNGNAYPISTMLQTNYQALGTTAEYDIAFPEGYLPNYLGYTVHGDGKNFVTVNVDPATKTLSVRLLGDISLINKNVEIRIPYRAQGDFVNPYLSVVIVPVYFQFTGLSVANHIETPILLLGNESVNDLTYRVVANYDSALTVVKSRLSDFNGDLRNSHLLQYTDESEGVRTVQFSYSYVNGVPVIMRGGDLLYEQTFYYETTEQRDVLERTVYLAIGCEETYDFEFDALRKSSWYVKTMSGAANDLWQVNMTRDGSGIFSVILTNDTALIGKTLTVEIASNLGTDLKLHVVPVYFTFDGFKTQDYPVDPLIALSQPFTVTLAADNVVSAGGLDAIKALNDFNAALLAVQEDANKELLSFTRVPNEDGILNFNFSETTRALSRNDLDSPVTAISYLKATATVTYVNGCPQLAKNGQKITTYFTVKTYGSNPDGGDENENPLDPMPSSRYRKTAQAIGTQVTYNIALKDVTFDSALDCYETSSTVDRRPWNSNSAWRAELIGNQIKVTLDDETALFGMTLAIDVYAAEDNTEPVYTLHIVPAWFTVDDLVIIGHADENPLQIIRPETVDSLYLDFTTTHGDLDYEYTSKIEAFRENLLNTELITRIADNGILTLLLSLRYINGEPVIVSRTYSSDVTVEKTCRYEILASGPKVSTLAQAIGTSVDYDRIPYGKQINRVNCYYFDEVTNDYVQVINKYVEGQPYTYWDAYRNNNNTRTFQVSLGNDPALFNYRLKVEVFTDGTGTPECVLYIIPAYFVVDGLAVEGQSGNEIWFTADSTAFDPNELINGITYVGAINSHQSGNNIAVMVAAFNTQQLRDKADLIERTYDSDATAGRLATKIYLKYVNGEPVLVAPNEDYDVCLTSDFNYQIYGPGEYNPNYPKVPDGPRTRTAVQAIGTAVRYHIDLPAGQSLAMKDLSGDDNLWTAVWEDDELVVTLDANVDLLNKTIKLSFYSELDFSASGYLYELTIKPVLFEVVGFAIANHPEQPVTLLTEADKTNVEAVVKHLDIYQNGDEDYKNVVSLLRRQLKTFNTVTLANRIKENDKQFWQFTDDCDATGRSGSLTFRAAINYSDRTMPRLANINNYPADVIETTLAYKMVDSATQIGTKATYFQPLGTTEYYPLPYAMFHDDTTGNEYRLKTTNGNYWNASIVEYKKDDDIQRAVKVQFELPGLALLGNDIKLEIVTPGAQKNIFTLTIKPVYFVVEGLEVSNHPERPLWLLSTPEGTENVSSLQFYAKVRRSYAVEIKQAIDTELALFNSNLQNDWRNYLEKTAIGGEYLVVRGAVTYNTASSGDQLTAGTASVVPMAQAGQNGVQTLRNVFQYKIYSTVDGGSLPDTGVARPTETRHRSTAQAIGLTDTYTIDMDDLSAFGAGHLYLSEENADGTKGEWNSNSGWRVAVDNGNRLLVSLDADEKLLTRKLIIAISYNTDYYNPAYILQIQPAWFKVTGIAIKGHPENPIKIDSDKIDDFLGKTNDGKMAKYECIPVTVFDPDLADIVQPKIDAFITRFNGVDNNLVYKTPHTSSDGNTNYLRATTSISYTFPDATAGHDGVQITAVPEDRIWNVFTIIPAADHNLSKTVVQGIGSTKEYYLDFGDNVDKTITRIDDGATAVVNGDRVTVTLNADADLVNAGREIVIVLGNLFTLRITPVWFEVESLAVAGHPERPVWLFSPATTTSLTYRAQTNDDIPADLGIEEKVAEFNAALNAQRTTMLSETVTMNKYVTVNAAINYVNGMPTLTRITGDLSNVVELVYEYYVWTDSRVPDPEHPAVVGTTQVNQVIGGSKNYTLKNIQGKVYYQWIWVEGAGELTAAANATTLAYEGVVLNFNALQNSLTVAIKADTAWLNQPIKINIPYTVTVNKQEIWRTHCLEITPLLLEVYGWQILPDDTVTDDIYRVFGDYLLLASNQGQQYPSRIVPKVNHSAAEELADDIADAKVALQSQLDQDFALMNIDYTPGYIQIALNDNSLSLVQNTDATTNNPVTLSGRVVYNNGCPTVVSEGGSMVENQVMISTGSPEPWPPTEPLVGHQQSAKQAIGTDKVYQLDFQGEEYDEILVDDVTIRVDGELVYGKITVNGKETLVNDYEAFFPGEFDVVTVEYDATAQAATVKLGPVLALGGHQITVDIPYTVLSDQVVNGEQIKGTKYYRLNLTPLWFTLNGFTLVGHASNYIQMNNQDVQITLAADVERPTSVTNSLRTNINLAIDNFEYQVATLLKSQNLDEAWTITNFDGSVNNYVSVVNLGGNLWLQRVGSATASHRVTTQIRVVYANGVPVLVTDPAATADATFTIEILVDTNQDAASLFPGMDKITEGERHEFQQAIGTSQTYTIDKTNNATETLYFSELAVKNGGPKRDPKNYEYFDLQVVANGTNYGQVLVTFKPQVRLLINPIEIMIPYAKYQTEDGKDGDKVWYYYTLVIKPVLFEVIGWGVEDENGNVVKELVIDDSAVELKFAPIIRSAPLDSQTFINNPDDPNNAETSELIFISNSIRNLKKQINDYNEAVADKYTYLVINNYPAEGHQVNYSLYRDEGAQKTYILREVNENTYTTVNLSATISYQVNGFDTTTVDGVQAVVGYDDLTNGLRVSSSIIIKTTDQKTSDENLMVITQDNASVLRNLSANTDYILMGDIYLSGVSENGWQPATFPTGTTLDGNNFKIYIDGNGFDLSNTPSNIGIFTNIPSGSVVKNLQVVIPQGTSFDKTRTLELDLSNYGTASVNIGLLAGSNSGVITNCAVLSEWQFIQDLSNASNALMDKYFSANWKTAPLQFNMDGYLFGRLTYKGKEDTYFFETTMNSDREVVIERIYNSQGYRLIESGKDTLVEYVDKYQNSIEFITPDTTSVARYDNYSVMLRDGSSAARMLVKGTNENLSVVVGGLVGLNTKMITNSRVLIDVELTDLTGGADNVDDAVSVKSAIVGGFVGTNSAAGTITASFFRDGNVINNANVNSLDSNPICYLGGFVGLNQGTVLQSYAMGQSTNRQSQVNFTSPTGGVKTSRNSLGGFVHQNEGTISDCMVNLQVEKGGLDGFAGGFVYRNTTSGKITNCVENNVLRLIDAASAPLYKPFIALNATMTVDDAKQGSNTITDNLKNLYYAGNLEQVSASQFIKAGVLAQLSNNSTNQYSAIESYPGFSIGQDDNLAWYITANNTIWSMTDLGPTLRTPNDIAISYRKTIAQSSPYLFKPGTARNPYIIWDKDQFRRYVYSATPTATAADESGTTQNVDANRQKNHLRLVDNVTLEGIQDTYKITYTGTFEGNGLTLGGIGLPSVAANLATAGLFGKTEYATIRNINFAFSSNINSTARYVGGVAGISINTNFVDVNLTGSSTVMGANIVGGIAGLTVITDPHVENYNVNSSISVKANYAEGITSPGSDKFTSGEEYVRQTLYSRVEYRNIPREQAFGTAGGVFGFVTSNPNNYKVFDTAGNALIKARKATANYEIKDTNTGTTDKQTIDSENTDAAMFLRDQRGNVIDDTGLYYTDQIALRNIGGTVGDVSANVAGGLIGIMDETIELHEPTLRGLSKLTGKYYLGGVVGINLGKITGGSVGKIADDGTLNTLAFNANSSVSNNYIFRYDSDASNPKHFWGMTIGAVAAYNNGMADNLNSGTIENTKVNVNVMNTGNANKIYVIGGVVGEAGTYSTLTNVENDVFRSASNAVLFTASDFGKIGFYVGKIVGRAMLDTNNSRSNMVMMPASVATVYQDCFVSATDFATPNYQVLGNITNAFGIKTENGVSVTHKVQTMTMAEYQQYILYNLVNTATVSELITALERWYRGLPTYITSATINGKNVFVEKLTDVAYNDFVNWLTVNDVFGNFTAYNYTAEENGETVTKNRLLNDYVTYLEYTAISPVNAGEAWFRENLAECRDQRYQLAEEFFAYKSQAANSATQYPAVIRFTWEQYENYRYLLAGLGMKENDYYHRAYGDEVLKYSADISHISLWLDNKDTEELGETLNSSGSTEKLKNYDELQELLDKMADGRCKQFSVNDPLLAYMNYVVESYTYRRTLGSITENVTHVPFGTRGNNWQMSFKQYVHFVNSIAGKDYGNTTKGKYDADLIADYYYSCYTLNEAASVGLTLNDYMSFKIEEGPTVLASELEWIKTGHVKDDGQMSGVRLSGIGAVELEWTNSASDWDTLLQSDKVTVEIRGDEIVYTNKENEVPFERAWAAISQYELARSQGIDIIKYKELCGLGGSLYELRELNAEGALKYETVDAYIFHLKVPQYAWTTAQEEFIRATFGLDNIRYALSATYYGDILQQEMNNVMAIELTTAPNPSGEYTTRVKNHKFDGQHWYYDQVDDGDAFNSGVDRKGTWFLNTGGSGLNNTFTNGDGTVYQYVGTAGIDLRENTDPTKGKVQGAALYIDANGDKLFTVDDEDQKLGSGDVLILYEVADAADADFQRKVKIKDKDGKDTEQETTKYYKISRRILPDGTRTTTKMNVNEYSGNHSDFLEEALWWQDQGFTAEQFDQIKNHAMLQSIPEAGQVKLEHPDTETYKVLIRNPGFVVADDWYAMTTTDNQTKIYGFSTTSPKFTTTEYTNLVLKAQYTIKKDNDGKIISQIWYSNYADFMLFSGLMHQNGTGGSATTKISSKAELTKEYTPYGSDTTYVAFPFGRDTMEAITFNGMLVRETILAAAMTFQSDKEAYLQLKSTGHTTAEYVTWAIGHPTTQDKTTYYFGMNHYIYWHLKDRGDLSDANLRAFEFALKQTYRSRIYYTDITQENRTDDLFAYKDTWEKYLSFRDYEEWLNVYAHGDDFKADRGEVADGVDTGDVEIAADPSGWLTIYSYAAWKRMEKYENNVEYINKGDQNSGITHITTPILKRQISTTIFPKISSSGNTGSNGVGTSLPALPKTSYKDGENEVVIDMSRYYGWSAPANRARPFYDRYEYNEKYLDGYYVTDSDGKNVKQYFTPYTGGTPYALDTNDEDRTKARYTSAGLLKTNFTYADWNRYTVNVHIGNLLSYSYWKGVDILAWNESKNENDKVTGYSPTNFTQLYVPFDTFKRACKQIQSYYSKDNDYVGYHNFMHYWAMNGEWWWIGDTSESTVEVQEPFAELEYTYLSTDFWNKFDPKNNQHPYTGDGKDAKKTDADGNITEYKNYGKGDYAVNW